jgi:hypothetical protein
MLGVRHRVARRSHGFPARQRSKARSAFAESYPHVSFGRTNMPSRSCPSARSLPATRCSSRAKNRPSSSGSGRRTAQRAASTSKLPPRSGRRRVRKQDADRTRGTLLSRQDAWFVLVMLGFALIGVLVWHSAETTERRLSHEGLAHGRRRRWWRRRAARSRPEEVSAFATTPLLTPFRDGEDSIVIST